MVGSIIELLILVSLSTVSASTQNLSRNDFPPDFIFGVGSSAYQYEGAAAEDGRKPSIFDTFTHREGTSLDGSNGDVAVDQYHRYKEDIDLMSAMGVDAYRFSISWPRLIPDGEGPINPKGVEYYNNLINELLSHGIQPHVTLYHFDLPQALEDSYGGFLNPQIVEDFKGYADVCFREFGDRVKYWSTFNEPNMFSTAGYDQGYLPPQRCSQPFGNCTAGNSTVEPYIVGHHVLLSHIAAVELYRKTYQEKQKGWIGLVILVHWMIPLTNKSTDVAATQRANDFIMGWLLDPFVSGDYPGSMRNIVGSRLPSFTKEQAQKLRGSLDFIGVNHYVTMYCFDVPRKGELVSRDYAQDMSIGMAVERDGIPLGVNRSIFGLPVVPQSMQAVLEYIEDRSQNIPIIVYENGFSEPNNSSIPLSEALNDQFRKDLHHDVLQYVLAAIRNGSDIRGYFIWTLLDDFEALSGYTSRFGLHYVDFNDNLKRYLKLSAHWYKTFLQRRESRESILESKILLNTYTPMNVS